MNESIILVDEHDMEIGISDKLTVHQTGKLHRAFSIFIYDSAGRLLLQQRADGKYHSAGLWSNTCCSHPRKGESVADAASRRLAEEMGLYCDLSFLFKFTYKAAFENGMTEHELDHIYFGYTDEIPTLNTEEVKNWKYLNLEELQWDIEKNPNSYTVWLKICLPEVIKHAKIR